VALAHVAAGTSTIRVGAGGIMLPNHAPLVIAEQFGTLAALHPGRIDLGVGRAPGTDGLTARALRRTLQGEVDDFPQDVLELIAYFAPHQPGQRIQAVPGAGLEVPVWILGSSLYGAQLAAVLGLPYAFASHFAPGALEQALHVYRRDFRPSAHLSRPYAAAGFNVFAADTDAEGELLASSVQQAFVNLRTGTPGPLPPPQAGYLESLPAEAQAMLRSALSCTAAGGPATVRRALEGFIARTGVDEIILTSQTFDPAARLRSFTIAADILGQGRPAQAA
jgi:luciferase family oxidoreductase group 1